MPIIKFEAKSTTRNYWIAVDDRDVVPWDFDRGVGEIDVAGGSHRVTWWLGGNPGDSLGFTGKDGDRLVVQVKKSTVPDGETSGAGSKPFQV